MTKRKDPAFLFYSKDWLEGSAELYPAEKGIYIDLLAHQNQKGSLPADVDRLARMLGLTIEEFEPLWSKVKEKFVCNCDGRLVNKRLTETMTERSTKAHTNSIIGKFASLCRTARLPQEDYINLKKSFNIADFTHFELNEATERLTDWFHSRLKSIANATVTANANEDIKKGGVGGNSEKGENTARVPLKGKTGDKGRKVPKVPTEAAFLSYGREILGDKYPGFEFPLRAKYRAWSEAGWKDGSKPPRPIKNWKTKLQNVIPFLRPFSPSRSADQNIGSKFDEGLS